MDSIYVFPIRLWAKISFILFNVLLIGVLVFALHSFVEGAPLWAKVLIIGFVVVSPLLTSLFILAFVPKRLELSDDKLQVSFYCGNKKAFPLSDFKDICHYEQEFRLNGTIRTCGMSGFGINSGIFKNSTLGEFEIYTTDKQPLYILTMKSGRIIIMNMSETMYSSMADSISKKTDSEI